MSYIEIFFLVILVASLVAGYRRGLIRQLGDIAGVVVGIIVCRLAGKRASELGAMVLGDHLGAEMGQHLSAYAGNVVLFLLVWLGVRILVRLLKLTTNALMLGAVDHAAGALFMTGKCAIGVSILLNIWALVFPDKSLAEGSEQTAQIINHVADLTPWLLGQLAPLASGIGS